VNHTITTSSAAHSVFAADVDDDGDLDVVFASALVGDGKIVWCENIGGAGAFWMLHTISTGSVGLSAYAADVDGDGDLDALSAWGGENKIGWYRNDSIHRGITFVERPEIDAPGAEAVFAADVDGDGDLDALSASLRDDTIAWHENLGGAGTDWVLHTISTSVIGPQFVTGADVDGDGDMDAISNGDNVIAWYENVEGAGTTWILHTISTASDSVENVADMDGDGDLDVISLSTWFENVGGRGSSWALHKITEDEYATCTADVDGDGDLDLFQWNWFRNRIDWYENLGGATSWGLHTISTSEDDAQFIFAADMDSDGDNDLVLNFNAGISWYENVGGAGTSWQHHTISTTIPDFVTSLYVADVDGDGDLDPVVSSSLDQTIVWYENLGGGGTSWVPRTISTGPAFFFSIYMADVDRDGDLDALAADKLGNRIAWYESRVGGMDYYTVTPCRLLDTRISSQGPALTTGDRELVVPPSCGIPVDALAVAINVTVVSPTAAGRVTVVPGGGADPGTSTINFVAGQTRANNQLVGLAPDFSGKLILRAFVPGGQVDFLIDVVGYF
jgi:hypothetical protein